MSTTMSENLQVTRRAGLIGFFTFLSRLSGLARDAVIAFFFGATFAADAFYMAFTLPNLLRRFVAEGALTIAFVPIFTKEMRRSRESAKMLSDQAFSWLSLLLVFLTAAGIYLTPWILKLMAAGFEADPEKFDLTVNLARTVFPYIFFVSLAAWVMGVLNSCKKFGAPAAAPVFLNIGLIGGALLSHFFDPPAMGLVAGALAGGAMQVFVQLPELKRLGFFPRVTFKVHPELKSLLGLMLPAAYGAAVYQVNVIILRYFASYLPEGAVSYLWYANRLFEFPMGVFAIALATAVLPTLSEFAAEGKWEAFKESINHSLRLNFLITIPAMVGLLMLAGPIVHVLLERGEFTLRSGEETARTLMGFALGLPFLGVVRLTVPAFYAMKDAKRPVLFATLAVVVNLGLAGWWVKEWEHVGLALALSAAAVVNAFGLLLYLRFKVGPLGLGSVLRVIAQSLAAAGVMWGFLRFVFTLNVLDPSNLLWQQGLGLLGTIIGSILVYFLTARLLGCKEVKDLWSIVRRKFRF